MNYCLYCKVFLFNYYSKLYLVIKISVYGKLSRNIKINLNLNI